MLTFFKQMLNSRRWEDRFGAINGILAIIETLGGDEAASDESLDAFLW